MNLIYFMLTIVGILAVSQQIADWYEDACNKIRNVT